MIILNNKLSLMSWNINQRSGFGCKENFTPIVFEEINKHNTDLIILSEFVKFPGYLTFISQLKNIGYIVMCDPRSDRGVNEILIAVKEDVLKGETFTIKILPNVETKTSLYPNFLHVSLKYDGQELNIIGIRIRIRNSSPSDYQKRKLQLDSLIRYMSKIEGSIILAGDFNNGYFKDGETSTSYNGKSREFYSYPLLKEESKGAGLNLHTPKEYGSWKNMKLDHILTRGLDLINPIYDWGFTKNNNYQPNEIGVPDHAMLLTTISI